MTRKKHQINLFIETSYYFFKREVLQKHLNTFLGPIWIIILPISFSIISSYIFSKIFSSSINGINYITYALSGMIIWNFFSQSISHATNCLVDYRPLIKNTPINKAAIVAGIILSKSIDLLINILVLLGISILIHQQINIHIFALIITFLIQIIFHYGLGIIISIFNFMHRDIKNIVNIILQLLFYSSPIIYPLEIVPQPMRSIISANPITLFINTQRQAIFLHQANYTNILILLIISLLTVLFAKLVYQKYQSSLSEYA